MPQLSRPQLAAALHCNRLFRREIDTRLGQEVDAEREIGEGTLVGHAEVYSPVRRLLDEQITPEVARQLRKRGCDVVAVSEARMSGAGDEQVLTIATAEVLGVLGALRGSKSSRARLRAGSQDQRGVVAAEAE